MIYITRHGESTANVEHVFSNRGLKHPLTDKGKKQSENLALLLQGVRITSVYASPILRAIETASIVCSQLHIPRFEVNSLLREYDVGFLEGLSDAQSWDLYFKNERQWISTSNRDSSLFNGETFNQVQQRFRQFIDYLFSSYSPADHNVLIVTHGGLLKIGLPAVVSNQNINEIVEKGIGNCQLLRCQKSGSLLHIG
ncbi:MAG TPA: histidine phosphatase family protein [Treponemataceae bacterium]|nr:histidine phosphatase family protein [Treponemataceae bacterium]